MAYGPSREKRNLLIREDGYRMAMEWKEGAKKEWPDDPEPPSDKDRLVLYVPGNPQGEEWAISSVRGVLVGRELPGGPMGERFGIVCGKDARRKSQYVNGGGKVQPDWDGTSADRLMDGEDREFARGAMVSESDEELRCPFTPNWNPEKARDHTLWGNRYFLCGLRPITEKVTDVATGETAESIVQRDGVSVADAYFLAITHERLGNFEGQTGETKERCVMPASELLRDLTREERTKNVLPILPYSQKTALALMIICAGEIFGKNMPPAMEEAFEGVLETAREIARTSKYAKHFERVLQEGPWEV